MKLQASEQTDRKRRQRGAGLSGGLIFCLGKDDEDLKRQASTSVGFIFSYILENQKCF